MVLGAAACAVSSVKSFNLRGGVMGEEESRGVKPIFEAIRVLLDGNKKLFDYVFEPGGRRLRDRAGILKEEAWGFEEHEQLLIRVSLDLWSGSGHVQLWELFERWERSDWMRFQSAMQLFIEAPALR